LVAYLSNYLIYLLGVNWHVELWQKITGSLTNAFRYSGVKKDIIDLQDKQIAVLREENLVLTRKLEVSESQRATFEAKIIDLEKALENLRPSAERLNTVQDQILQAFYRNRLAIALDSVSSILRIDYEIIANHTEKLKDLGMIRWTGRGAGDWENGLPTYELTDKGKAYLEENKLV